ncbi:MAG: leucine-rich repeat domain-containing protein [Alphaproteobacteria bacterium]|nr:leucine-rich repeat domain-containing protein [Alphaproteobacteria bacterium]
MKKIVFVFSLALPFYANAWEPCGTDALGNTANCEYQIVNGTLTIRGTGDNGNIGTWDLDSGTIAPWTGKGVTNVVIEDSIKNLGKMGFADIKSQNPIVIPNSITTIGYNAFFLADTSEIIIPDSVTDISNGAFDWSSIKKIDIPDSVKILGGLRGTNLVDVVVPDSVEGIRDIAFSHCLNLQSLTIGENTQLGDIFRDINDDGERVFTDIANLKIYCTGDTAKCDANLAAAGYPELKTSKATTKQINGVTYVYDKSGKLVTSSGHRSEKRIYTIEEANAVAGARNRVSIKYR